MKKNIILRCNVVSALRSAMTDHGFLEITTPILTASSPEGARDYLVPARKHPGKFYALPQAPQQFKQLLMTSGFDKYFQIAPASGMRTPGATAPPGEFYQLDMEMSFATQDDVFAVLEDVLPPIFAKFGTYNVASTAPFKRIGFTEAMETYGSDKPDLRIDLTVTDVTELLSGCGFEPFAGNTVKAIVVTDFAATRKQIDKLCADVEVQAGSKPYWFRMDENGQIAGGIAKFLSGREEAVKEALGLQPNTFVGPHRREERRRPEGRRRAAEQAGRPLPPTTWTRSATSSAGSWTSPCTRSARRAGSWSSATTPSPCPTAARRSGQGHRRGDRPPDHHRLPVRPGVQRRGAELRRGAEPRPGNHDQGLQPGPPGRGGT